LKRDTLNNHTLENNSWKEAFWSRQTVVRSCDTSALKSKFNISASHSRISRPERPNHWPLLK